MSQLPISRSPDLSRLRAEGYDISVSHGHLIVRDVPYLDSDGRIVRGILVKPLTLTGDVSGPPNDHTVHLVGPLPHDSAHRSLTAVHSSGTFNLVPGLPAQHLLSRKPAGGYPTFYELITTYSLLLSKHAKEKDPSVTAQTYPTVRSDADDIGPFLYIDTASARAGITVINAKLEGDRIALIGLGGTGAYILDYVAKSPVARIDLFDGDVLMQHNAFRYPGAVPIEVIEAKPMKVDYFAGIYAAMRTGVIPHPAYVTAENISEVLEADFTFIAIDDNPSRKLIAKTLQQAGKSFIDVGMGLFEAEGRLGGQLRVTASFDGHRDHLWDSRHRLPVEASPDDLYDQNIQIVDLNALNAALAVGRWKRFRGVFADLEDEHYSVYVVDGNDTVNEDKS